MTMEHELMSKYSIVIPVRYASTRFPGKPLSMIGDKTMLAHVIDRCKASAADRIIVSTDDERIAQAYAKGHDVANCNDT